VRKFPRAYQIERPEGQVAQDVDSGKRRKPERGDADDGERTTCEKHERRDPRNLSPAHRQEDNGRQKRPEVDQRDQPVLDCVIDGEVVAHVVGDSGRVVDVGVTGHRRLKSSISPNRDGHREEL
jgi:hypothetical protein